MWFEPMIILSYHTCIHTPKLGVNFVVFVMKWTQISTVHALCASEVLSSLAPFEHLVFDGVEECLE